MWRHGVRSSVSFPEVEIPVQKSGNARKSQNECQSNVEIKPQDSYTATQPARSLLSQERCPVEMMHVFQYRVPSARAQIVIGRFRGSAAHVVPFLLIFNVPLSFL